MPKREADNQAMVGVEQQSPLDKLLQTHVKHPPDPVEPPKPKRQWLPWPDEAGYWWVKPKEQPRVQPEPCRAGWCCGDMIVYNQNGDSLGSKSQSQLRSGASSDYLFTKVTDRPEANE